MIEYEYIRRNDPTQSEIDEVTRKGFRLTHVVYCLTNSYRGMENHGLLYVFERAKIKTDK